MKICIDCAGAESGLCAPVDGIIRALNEFSDIEIIACGDEKLLSAALSGKQYDSKRLSVFHAPDIISMHDPPAKAVREKPRASMSVAFDAVKNGDADIIISSGSTGALLSGAVIKLGRIKGVLRPAMAPVVPTATGQAILIDCGANSDCKPEYLLQFAQMAAIYVHEVFHVVNPIVGLVNIGTEEAKGNELAREAYKLLKASDLNFIGNVERDLLSGQCDVLVTDGFTGNVILKHSESIAKMLFSMIKDAMTANLMKKLAAAVLKPSLSALKDRFNADEYGGALFLGVKAGVIKVHGNSTANNFYAAIKQARLFIAGNVVVRIESALTKE